MGLKHALVSATDVCLGLGACASAQDAQKNSDQVETNSDQHLRRQPPAHGLGVGGRKVDGHVLRSRPARALGWSPNQAVSALLVRPWTWASGFDRVGRSRPTILTNKGAIL